MEEHKCNEYLCKGCNQYVLKPHNCFMAKTKLKQPSNKYVFFDFETTLDNQQKHIVNYGIAQYFAGEEQIFTNIDEFCNWAFDKNITNTHLLLTTEKDMTFSLY